MRYFLSDLYLRYLLWSNSLSDWTYEFKDLHSSGGLTCSESRNIVLSKQAIERLKWWDLRDLILHEVAHALIPEGKPHCLEWKEMFLKLGGSGRVCCKNFSLKSDYKWLKSCTKCDYKELCFRRYSLWCEECGSAVRYTIFSEKSQ